MSWEGVGVGRKLSDSSRELEEGEGVGELGSQVWLDQRHTSPLPSDLQGLRL